VQLGLASLLVDIGNWEALRGALRATTTQTAQWPYTWQQRASMIRAQLALADREATDAARLIATIVKRAEQRGDPFLLAEVRTLRARLLAMQGQPEAALAELRGSIYQQIALASAQSYPLYRSRYAARALADLDAYLQLSHEFDPGPEAARERLNLLDQVRAAGDPTRVTNAVSTVDTPELGAARARLNEGLRRHWLPYADEPPEESSHKLLDALARVETALQTRSSDPARVGHEGALDPASSTLVVYLGEVKGFVWISRLDSLREVPIADPAALLGHADRLYQMLTDPASEIAAIEQLAAQLSATLGLDSEHSAQWVAALDPSLARIPPVLLLRADGKIPSIRQVASLLSAGGQSSECCQTMAINAFADPVVGAPSGSGPRRTTDLSRLPGSRREIRRIASDWPGAFSAHVGAEFSDVAVLSALQSPTTIVHLATHGLFDPRVVGLNSLLAIDGNNPSRLSIIGWNDILRTRIRSPLVTLGACNAGAGVAINYTHSVGLAQAFLAAGAGAVVAPTWPLDDLASEAFVAGFYAALAQGLAPDQAIARSQQTMRNSARYAHPFHWATMRYYQ